MGVGWSLRVSPPITASPFQNNIPVLSPALTDGSLGDMIFFHSYKHPGLVLDIVEGECVPRCQGPVPTLPPTLGSCPPDARVSCVPPTPGSPDTHLCPQTCASLTPRPSSPGRRG